MFGENSDEETLSAGSPLLRSGTRKRQIGADDEEEDDAAEAPAL